MEIKLRKPLNVGGEEKTSLSFDFERLTGADIIDASNEARMLGGPTLNTMHSTVFQAVIASKACGVLYHDLINLDARDFFSVVTAASGFLFGMDLTEIEE